MPQHTDTVDDIVAGPSRTRNQIASVDVSVDDETTTDARYKNEDDFAHDWKTFFAIKTAGVELELCTDFQLHVPSTRPGRETEPSFERDGSISPTGSINTDDWYMWSRGGRLVATLQLSAIVPGSNVSVEMAGTPQATVLKVMVSAARIALVTITFEPVYQPDLIQFAQVQKSMAGNAGRIPLV